MLDGWALEADSHAIGFLGDAIVGVDERAAADLREILFLRSPDDANGPAAVVEGRREPALVAVRRLVARERQGISGRELAAFEAADAGAAVG